MRMYMFQRKLNAMLKVNINYAALENTCVPNSYKANSDKSKSIQMQAYKSSYMS